ncbi:hypothetical protein BDP81DRAFT_454279 [Colletotrichum phormii]|uniref:Uncharacterized protein n=1 Tax=Colletotrichum phormii TaxID=359342 RepID=A0AAI9ZI68_9PEZI|nr:uncharacterized protein BDP81DRAFT_454279 [Colletotrichum phormii]KAK1623841.1 hypothetical protein BDP81DRAFT_454279 [Colletotrichum phormii]
MSHLVADWENTDIDAHKHNVNTIKWFCSVPFPNPENEEERKIQESPRGVMCSLVNQLLRVISDKFPGFILSSSFLDHKDFADRPKNREIEALWEVFGCLVVELPWGADVMCVIDEITTYETSDLKEDLDFIIGQLVKMAIRQSGEPIALKFIVKCQTTAKGVREHFEDSKYSKDNIIDG